MGLSLRVAALGLALAGCATGPYVIERTVGGERRAGVFVPPFAYEHFVRAEVMIALGDDTSARDELELARAGGADDPLLCARLAETLERLGDHAGADRALADGRALDADSEPVELAAGTIAESRGDLDGALHAFAAAHHAAPDSAAPIVAIARLVAARGADGRALALLASLAADGGARGDVIAHALSTDDPAELESLIEVLGAEDPRLLELGAVRALALEHPALALRLLDRALPGASTRALRVEAARRARDERALRDALATPPALEDEAAILGDARAWLTLGDGDQAELYARLVLAHGPSPAATVVLGLAQEARGALVEAALTLASVPPGTTVSDEARVALGRVLARAGLAALADELR